MGVDVNRARVLGAAQPVLFALLSRAGLSVSARPRPLADAGEVDVDVAVVFRGRLLGRNQAALLSGAGVPVIEVLTVEPPSPSTECWVRLSNRVPKSDLVQVVHAVVAWRATKDVGANPVAA